MKRRDWDLLGKQLGRITDASRNDGLLILAMVTVLFVGIALGGLVFAPQPQPQPTRTAMNEAASTMAFFLKGAPPRQQ
jgi:hypothetical protein